MWPPIMKMTGVVTPGTDPHRKGVTAGAAAANARHRLRSQSTERELGESSHASAGVEHSHISSDSAHLDEFTCALCRKMAALDAYTTIPCSHPFCKQCFEGWLDTKKPNSVCNCPNCGVNISDVSRCKPSAILTYEGHQVGARPMSQGQPLAYRVLKRVKVLCPHRDRRKCQWTGEYRELKAHLATHTCRKARPQSPGRRRGRDMLGGRERDRSMTSSPGPHNQKDNLEGMNIRVSRSQTKSPQPRSRRSSLDMKSGSSSSHEYGRSNSLPTNDKRQQHTKVQPRNAGSGEKAVPRSPIDADKNSRFIFGERKAPSPLSDKSSGRQTFHDKPVSKPDDKATTVERRHSLSLADLGLKRTRSLQDMQSPKSQLNSSGGTSQSSHGWDRVRQNTASPSPSATLSTTTHSSNSNNSSKSLMEQQQSHKRRSQSQKRQSFLNFGYTLKEKANSSFKNGRYEEATVFYTEAIVAYTSRGNDEEDELAATLFSNRAASFLRMNQYEPCIKDCDCAIRLNQHLMKAYLRKAWAHIEMGSLEDACTCLKTGLERNPTSKELESELKSLDRLLLKMTRVTKLMEAKNYDGALAAARAIDHYKSNIRVRLLVARAELVLGSVDAVLRRVEKTLVEYPNHVEALEIRAQAHLLNANFTEAVADVKAALQRDPDSASVQTSFRKHLSVQRNVLDARKAVYARQFTKAVALYTNAIDDCKPLSTKTELYRLLHTERAEANLALSDYDAALLDTQLALAGSNMYTVAWVTRVKAYQSLRRYSDIHQELEAVIDTLGANCDFLRKAFEEAKNDGKAERRPPRPATQRTDYYAVFGVKVDATEEEIRKQYKLKAKECHPDRFMSSRYSDKERKAGEERFKMLGEGLELLCDPYRRSLYDSGVNIESIRNQGNAADRRAAADRGDTEY